MVCTDDRVTPLCCESQHVSREEDKNEILGIANLLSAGITLRCSLNRGVPATQNEQSNSESYCDDHVHLLHVRLLDKYISASHRLRIGSVLLGSRSICYRVSYSNGYLCDAAIIQINLCIFSK